MTEIRTLLVLGGGTAGTMVANRLRRRLDRREWRITVVDQDDVHAYQPGFLFIPFGGYKAGGDCQATAAVHDRWDRPGARRD